MDLSKIDFTKKENQTFKNWFALMNKNGYIAGFVLAFVATIWCIIKSDTFYDIDLWGDVSINGFYIMLTMGLSIMLLIAHQGFYKFWNYIKKLPN